MDEEDVRNKILDRTGEKRKLSSRDQESCNAKVQRREGTFHCTINDCREDFHSEDDYSRHLCLAHFYQALNEEVRDLDKIGRNSLSCPKPGCCEYFTEQEKLVVHYGGSEGHNRVGFLLLRYVQLENDQKRKEETEILRELEEKNRIIEESNGCEKGQRTKIKNLERRLKETEKKLDLKSVVYDENQKQLPEQKLEEKDELIEKLEKKLNENKKKLVYINNLYRLKHKQIQDLSMEHVEKETSFNIRITRVETENKELNVQLARLEQQRRDAVLENERLLKQEQDIQEKDKLITDLQTDNQRIREESRQKEAEWMRKDLFPKVKDENENNEKSFQMVEAQPEEDSEITDSRSQIVSSKAQLKRMKSEDLEVRVRNKERLVEDLWSDNQELTRQLNKAQSEHRDLMEKFDEIKINESRIEEDLKNIALEASIEKEKRENIEENLSKIKNTLKNSHLKLRKENNNLTEQLRKADQTNESLRAEFDVVSGELRKSKEAQQKNDIVLKKLETRLPKFIDRYNEVKVECEEGRKEREKLTAELKKSKKQLSVLSDNFMKVQKIIGDSEVQLSNIEEEDLKEDGAV